MIKRLVLALAASVLTLWVWTAPSSQATFSACDGVWVVVDYGALGGVKTSCATSFSTGTAALRSAGFSPTLDNGFLTKINGLPGTPDLNKAYWSYWQATRNADGSYGGWKYAQVGANSFHPTKGNAEGWHYISASGSASAPGVTPPKNPTAPLPSASTKPTTKPQPTATPTKKTTPTTKAKPATKSTATVKATPSSAQPTTTSPGSASPSLSATSSPAPSTPPAAHSSGPSVDAPGTGSPTAAIATASVLAIGGVGAGGWWLWKVRRP